MSEGTPSESASAPRGSPPHALGAALLGLLHGHLELLGIELQELRSASVRLLLYSGLALMFALLLLIALSTLVLLLCWDGYRLQAIVGLCLLHGFGCLLAVWRLRSALRHPPSPFAATLEELARDREQLLP